MARTNNTRPDHLLKAERPYLRPGVNDGGRKPAQRAAHKQDRQAVRLALLVGAEPPLPQRRRVDWDVH